MTEAIRAQLDWPQLDGHPSRVEVELNDVRAARGLVIEYDFERDGWSIQANQWDPEQHPGEDHVDDIVEVAFVHAWPSNEPRHGQPRVFAQTIDVDTKSHEVTINGEAFPYYLAIDPAIAAEVGADRMGCVTFPIVVHPNGNIRFHHGEDPTS